MLLYLTIVINNNHKVVADRQLKYFEGIMNPSQSVEKFVKNVQEHGQVCVQI